MSDLLAYVVYWIVGLGLLLWVLIKAIGHLFHRE